MYALTNSGRDSRGAEVVIITCEACGYYGGAFHRHRHSQDREALRPVQEVAPGRSKLSERNNDQQKLAAGPAQARGKT